MTAPKYREPKQDLATLILYLRRHASERDIAFTALAAEIADWERREERKRRATIAERLRRAPGIRLLAGRWIW